ncbi:NADPH-dependent FMN reductase [Jiulongibacter sediminis]|uniref:NADPH-dependent FMN reductase n=1 Tax=Jiulongibacter sediminis TaxID=1605367 RepID=UPI0026F0CC3A|nr:NADPH-dependent FMN reductase [Jiulongibacter sediminis]
MKKPVGILVGTNRPSAMTLEMAMYYKEKLEEIGEEVVLMDLGQLPEDFAFSALYANKGKSEGYNGFQAKLDSVDKCIILAPEYNGSYPGVLKTFIDGLRYPDSFRDKKVALVGLANGVQGNAVGLGHLNDVLSYMGANVLGLRVKLGEIARHFDANKISHPLYEKFVNEQIEKFLSF